MLAISVQRLSILFPLTRSKFHLGALRSTTWSQGMSKASRTGLLGMSTSLSIYITDFDILNRSLHWSFRTHRYFGTEGTEVKRHRLIKLLPLRTEKLPSPPSMTTERSEVSTCTPKFSFGEKSSLVLLSWFSTLSPLVPSSIALRVYVYSAFITMSVFVLSNIFDFHPSFNSYNTAKI